MFVASSSTDHASVIRLDLDSAKHETIKRSSTIDIDPDDTSEAEQIAFETTNGETAYAFFYAPKNAAFDAPVGELPPLVVMSHGGPTAAASAAYSLGTQFWTTRGIGVLDVNYRGSTGYGRRYREALDGNWGIVDVDDCVNGALLPLFVRDAWTANDSRLRAAARVGFTDAMRADIQECLQSWRKPLWCERLRSACEGYSQVRVTLSGSA